MVDRAPIRTGPVRYLLRTVIVCGWVTVGVLMLEWASRRYIPIWHGELVGRHMQPYLMTGGYYRTPLAGIQESSPLVGLGSPAAFGYSKHGSTYLFDFRQAVSNVAERGAFLFQDRAAVARAPADGTLRIYVIGGSAAYGVGASARATRWFEILERDLGAGLGRPVRIIPAAHPGYVSTQERLVLDFIVLPHKPDAVVILDGWNDAVLPATFGVRPGDPYDQGMLYQQFYSPLHGSYAWLAQRSHLVRLFLHRSIERAITRNEHRLMADSALLRTYTTSVAAVYVDNVSRMLRSCGVEQVPCQVFLQPSLDVSRSRRGLRDDVHPIAEKAYGTLVAEALALSLPGAIHDLSTVLSGDEAEKWFVDSVHFGDAGHVALARAIYPLMLDLLRRQPATTPGARH
jgi:lysophospholipase L1-like esterase